MDNGQALADLVGRWKARALAAEAERDELKAKLAAVREALNLIWVADSGESWSMGIAHNALAKLDGKEEG